MTKCRELKVGVSMCNVPRFILKEGVGLQFTMIYREKMPNGHVVDALAKQQTLSIAEAKLFAEELLEQISLAEKQNETNK